MAHRCTVLVVVLIVVLVDVDVVLVVVSHPLQVLAHCFAKASHKPAANTTSHLSRGRVFVLLAHLPGVVVDVVVVELDDVEVDVDLDDVLVAVDVVVVVRMVKVVDVDVDVVVESHPPQVLSH